MSIVINTPTGNIGRALTLALLDAGEDVVVLHRDPAKVADLAQRGARVVQVGVEGEDALAAAFAGAEAVFWVSPPAIRPGFAARAAANGRRAAAAARAAGVKRAVVLSSLGAQVGPGAGPVSTLLPTEDAFRAALDDVLVLRPGFFMENLFADVGSIAAAGQIYSPIPGGVPLPMVATRDIAAVAALELQDRTWSGHRIRGVHGPADISGDEVAATLSALLGRPVARVTVPLEAARQGMLAAGMPELAADLYAEMYGAVISGHMVAAEPRTPETTTPTTLREFAAEVLVPAILAAA